MKATLIALSLLALTSTANAQTAPAPKPFQVKVGVVTTDCDTIHPCIVKTPGKTDEVFTITPAFVAGTAEEPAHYEAIVRKEIPYAGDTVAFVDLSYRTYSGEKEAYLTLNLGLVDKVRQLSTCGAAVTFEPGETRKFEQGLLAHCVIDNKFVVIDGEAESVNSPAAPAAPALQ